MVRNLINGLICGGLVGLTLFVLISVLVGQPIQPDVVTKAPRSGKVPITGNSSTTIAVADADLVVDSEPRQESFQTADNTTGVSIAGFDTSSIPEIGNIEVLIKPSNEIDNSGFTILHEEPFLPGRQSILPSVQSPEDVLSISTKPAQSLVPEFPQKDGIISADDISSNAKHVDQLENRRPIETFASPFSNPDDRPLVAIVLIDNSIDRSDGPLGIAGLNNFPFPLSFAVDATLPGASERMAEYRAQGFEVMTLLDVPQGATALDAEIALLTVLEKAPESIGVMEGVGTGLQVGRDVSDRLIKLLKSTGHGFLLHSKGLNTAQKLALREGVPTGLIFRDFDSAGQKPEVIRRFLDQAASRAGQYGEVIMLGRVRSETILALVLWSLQDRTEQVELAPISAVLLALAADH